MDIAISVYLDAGKRDKKASMETLASSFEQSIGKTLAAASRKETGHLRFELWQQEGRFNHLPVFEIWRDAQAQGAHANAPHTRDFRAKLVPLQGALYDERLYTAIR